VGEKTENQGNIQDWHSSHGESSQHAVPLRGSAHFSPFCTVIVRSLYRVPLIFVYIRGKWGMTDELASLPYVQALSAARQAAQGVFPSHRILRPRQRSQACDVLSRFLAGSLKWCSFCMAVVLDQDLLLMPGEVDRHISIRSGPTGMHRVWIGLDLELWRGIEWAWHGMGWDSGTPPRINNRTTAGKVERQGVVGEIHHQGLPWPVIDLDKGCNQPDPYDPYGTSGREHAIRSHALAE